MTITLRSPADGLVDLVVTKNGDCQVHALSPDQVRLIAVQAVTLWAEQCERAATSGHMEARIRRDDGPATRRDQVDGIDVPHGRASYR